MLAKDSWFTPPPCEPLPDLDYSGFPFWIALAAETPGRERRSADWLADKMNIHAYWPHYVVQRQYRNRPRIAQLKPVVPGMLFAPAEILDIDRRDEIFDWARLRWVKLKRLLTKAEIEIIRQIEAGLNICRSEKTCFFKISDRIRFLDPVKAAFLGEGTIIEVATGNRIGIRLDVKLIGTDIVHASAVELEVM